VEHVRPQQLHRQGSLPRHEHGQDPRRRGRQGPLRHEIGRRTGGQKLEGGAAMRCMVLVKASKDSEAGVMPSEKLLAAMGKYNEELMKAGVMLAGAGGQPTTRGGGGDVSWC